MNIPDMYHNLAAIKENAFQLFFLLKNQELYPEEAELKVETFYLNKLKESIKEKEDKILDVNFQEANKYAKEEFLSKQ